MHNQCMNGIYIIIILVKIATMWIIVSNSTDDFVTFQGIERFDDGNIDYIHHIMKFFV